MKTKIKAPASCGPTREIALLMADPSPALCAGIDRISAVVRGATVMESPRPKMIPAGKRSMRYDNGGWNVAGFCGSRCQGMLVAGTRAYHRTPSAMISGPTAMKMRGPYLAARLPNRDEKKIRKIEPGMPAAPAAAAV